MNFCILGSVKSLEICGFVDRNVSVDCHEDDDVDTGGHEGVDQGQLEMCLIECCCVGFRVQTIRDVMESRNGSDEDAEVGLFWKGWMMCSRPILYGHGPWIY